MAENRVLKNYLYNVSYQIVMTILPVATIPYLTRVLGASNLGVARYMESVVQMLSVFGLLGLVWYANRAVACDRGDGRRLSLCFWEIFLLRLVLMGATFFVFFLITAGSEYRDLYMIFGFYLAGTFLDTSWFFTGIEDMKPVVLRNYVVRIVSTVLLFVLVRDRGDLEIYLWLTCLTVFANSAAIAPFLRSRLERVPFSQIHVARHLLPALALFLPQAASQIYVQCDKVLIRHLLRDPSYISFYTENEKIAKMPVVLATALSTVLMPRIAYEFSRGKGDSVVFYIRKAFLCTVFVLAPCCAGLWAVAPSFVPLFLGAEFAQTYTILRLFCPVMLFIGCSNVTGIQYLVALGRTRELTVSYVTAALVNLGLDLLLIPRIGVYGAIAGTVTAELLVFLIQYLYMRKDLGRIGMADALCRIGICAACMGAAVMACDFLPLSLVPKLAVQVLAGVVLYTAAVFLCGVPGQILKRR